MLKPKAYDAKPQVQDYKPQVYENLYYALGHFNLIQYLADDFIRCHMPRKSSRYGGEVRRVPQRAHPPE